MTGIDLTLASMRARREAVLKLARRRRALRVRVFGPIARGEVGTASEVDLLVDFEPEASLIDQVGLVQDLEGLLGVRVQVISTGGLRRGHDPIRDEAVDL